MRFDILTLFPDQVVDMLNVSILGRAQKARSIVVKTHDLRAFGLGKHKQVDDTPYGGGAGLVLRPDVVIPAIKKVSGKSKVKPLVVLLTPQGKRLTQPLVEKLAQEKRLLLVAGHYEGFDERIRAHADLQISLGDFVLTGGELPAVALVDAVSRLVPGVLRNESPADESYSLQNEQGERVLEYPQYTKPEVYDGESVPKVLLSGNHAEIKKWRESKTKKI